MADHASRRQCTWQTTAYGRPCKQETMHMADHAYGRPCKQETMHMADHASRRPCIWQGEGSQRCFWVWQRKSRVRGCADCLCEDDRLGHHRGQQAIISEQRKAQIDKQAHLMLAGLQRDMASDLHSRLRPLPSAATLTCKANSVFSLLYSSHTLVFTDTVMLGGGSGCA